MIATGVNDPLFPGASMKPPADMPGIEFHPIDSGHFALEDRCAEIGSLTREPQVGFLFPVGNLQGYLNFKGYGEFDGKDRPSGWKCLGYALVVAGGAVRCTLATVNRHQGATSQLRAVQGWMTDSRLP
jgi:hypothetical protein